MPCPAFCRRASAPGPRCSGRSLRRANPPGGAGLLWQRAAEVRGPENQCLCHLGETPFQGGERCSGACPRGGGGQVEVAKKHIAYHMNKFGYQKPNVEFLQGYMEQLGDAGLADESYDIVISNCVINLVPDKRAVLQEAYRVLKPGGEMYFSDVYTSQHLSEAVRKHRVLWGECLAGALYWRDLYSIAKEVGFSPPCLVTASPITINNKELECIIGDCRFVSATFRLFKVPGSSRAGPGQVIYNGGITGHERELVFDANYTFKEGEVMDVDAEMAAILRSSRFAEEFLIRASGANVATPQGCCHQGVKDPALHHLVITAAKAAIDRHRSNQTLLAGEHKIQQCSSPSWFVHHFYQEVIDALEEPPRL
ncbi:arsenite methyltransferase isoform X3 [Apus apus]|uniref:arsenite methyltransferase isoform X3 n=1 Tax=Apus apus TaxID=8895 RepID=UPI0021F874F3|nr:arsenite methyltransferase isoform X3 [Apus apus]